MKMTKIELTKKIVSNVAMYGSGIITYQIIRNNLPANLSLPKKAAVFVASVVIGSMVADRIDTESNKLVDDFVRMYYDLREQVQ
jgi:hypothetical protein